MENTSKALIISAEILLGVILLTLMVFLFRAMGSFSDAVDKNIETKTISEFNAKFEQYLDKNLTAQDIITMGNAAKQYNERMEAVKLQVKVLGVGPEYQNAHRLDNKTSYEFIKKYSTLTRENVSEIQYFICTQMNYDTETGKINQIVIKKLQ